MTAPTTWDLYTAWANVHSEASSENGEIWAEFFEHFGRLVHEAGQNGALNELFQETMISISQNNTDGEDGPDEIPGFAETSVRESLSLFEEISRHEQVDPLPIFHNDIITACAAKMDFMGVVDKNGKPVDVDDIEKEDSEVADDDINIILSQTELFAIPVLGDHHTVHTLSERAGFTQLIREAGICHPNSNVVLLGAVPAELAAEELLNPEKICRSVLQVRETLLKTADLVPLTKKAGLEELAQSWNANIFAGAVPENVKRIGGYIILGGLVSVASADDENAGMLNIHGPDESQCQKWDHLLAEWARKQDDWEKLKMCSLGGPSPLREGIAIALADHLYTAILMQSEMEKKTLSKIDVVVPNDDIDFDDMATIYGYSENGEQVAHIKTRALTMGLIMPEIAETWEEIAEGCEITVTPTERNIIKKTKRILH